MQLRRFYGIWLNISLAVILQAPVCLRENEAQWHFEPRALGATAALLRFHAVRQPFQHREDYQSHQKTKLSISNWWEEKSFSLLHHRVPEVILNIHNAWEEYRCVYVTLLYLTVWSNVYSLWIMCWYKIVICLFVFNVGFLQDLEGITVLGE